MKLKIAYPIFLILAAVALHFVAVYSGIYDSQLREGLVWFDNILHFLVGVGCSLLWLWGIRRWFSGVPTTFVAISIPLFVIVVATMWEGSEYIFFKIFNSYALGLKVYSPSIAEAFFDSLSNFIGALVVVAVYLYKTWSTDQSHPLVH